MKGLVLLTILALIGAGAGTAYVASVDARHVLASGSYATHHCSSLFKAMYPGQATAPPHYTTADIDRAKAESFLKERGIWIEATQRVTADLYEHGGSFTNAFVQSNSDTASLLCGYTHWPLGLQLTSISTGDMRAYLDEPGDYEFSLRYGFNPFDRIADYEVTFADKLRFALSDRKTD